jgi:hypothetical protein
MERSQTTEHLRNHPVTIITDPDGQQRELTALPGVGHSARPIANLPINNANFEGLAASGSASEMSSKFGAHLGGALRRASNILSCNER